MKRLLTTLCLLVAVAAPFVRAEPLSKDELKSAVEYLEKTRAAVLKETEGLSDAQWMPKPSPTRWSVAEVTEHIAASEDFLMTTIKDNVMKAPPRAEKVDVAEIDAFILKAIPDRTQKVQAPEPLIPSNRFRTPKESLQHFAASRAQTLQFLKDTKDLREHAVESPLGKNLDGYQWLIFIGAHSERHTKQLVEVKADPNFPKS